MFFSLFSSEDTEQREWGNEDPSKCIGELIPAQAAPVFIY